MRIIKLFIFVALILLPVLSIGQDINIGTLLNIRKHEMESFNVFCLNNGFSYSSTHNGGSIWKKGDSKIISFTPGDNKFENCLSYVTTDAAWYKESVNSLFDYGFTKEGEFIDEKGIVQNYTQAKTKINQYPTCLQIEITKAESGTPCYAFRFMDLLMHFYESTHKK